MEQGGKAQRETPPPPLQPSASPPGCVVPTSCLRRACNGGEAKRAPLPPPNTSAPPRAGNAGREGAKSAPPPEGNAAGWGSRGRRVRDEPHDRARRGRAPCKPRRGDHRGCGRRIEGATKGAARQTPPPPAEGREPRLVPATREHRRENDKPPPPPHASAPPRVGDAGREGRTAAPPPEDKAARWGGSGERVRDGLHDRAQEKQAPSRPQRGGHRGSERRVGRAKTGATRRAPHPSRRTSAVPRASAVPATCLHRRKGSEGAAPPPPPPSPTPTKERGEGNGEKARGQEG